MYVLYHGFKLRYAIVTTVLFSQHYYYNDSTSEYLETSQYDKLYHGFKYFCYYYLEAFSDKPWNNNYVPQQHVYVKAIDFLRH